jgi:hypothetical protein
MVLSREEKAYKHVLEEAREQMKRMERMCPHVAVATGTGQGARCEICGKHFGWLCPESPDRVCHYDAWRSIDENSTWWVWRDIHEHKREVPKEKVERYIRPNEDMPYYNDEDCCIFCGHPSERK